MNNNIIYIKYVIFRKFIFAKKFVKNVIKINQLTLIFAVFTKFFVN